MDAYEVTNAQYKKFVDAKGYKAPLLWNDSNYNAPNQPVVGVSWNDAKAYADWAGERLPTEVEWEKAGRGGLAGKIYAWGDDWPPPKNSGNFADETAKKTFPSQIIINGYDDGYAYTAPVGSYKPNGYGLYDMAGNVWEWCADFYVHKYYDDSPKQNPKGPDSGKGLDSREARVLRGGLWYYCNTYFLRVSTRGDFGPAGTSHDIGFRCAGLSVTP
jgi:formylglycine-generating enzyme required for sulfatase activity